MFMCNAWNQLIAPTRRAGILYLSAAARRSVCHAQRVGTTTPGAVLRTQRRYCTMAAAAQAGDSDKELSYFLSQKAAQKLDEELMSEPYGFTLEQLMELAGLAVAQATYSHFVHRVSQDDKDKVDVVICCGPGNNGGDGLVAARHLYHFGLPVSVVYPRQGKNPYYEKLIKQLDALDIPVLTELSLFPKRTHPTTVLVDAVFGFSFVPTGPNHLREPFKTLIRDMNEFEDASIVSVDIPSGWHVEKGFEPGSLAIERPDVLVSLTAPKLGVREFGGPHYVGGRFVPPRLAMSTGLRVCLYPGADQFTMFKQT